MRAKGALAWTSAAAGTADGGLRQASPRGHEGDECCPCLARVVEERRRRCFSNFKKYKNINFFSNKYFF